MGLLTETIQLAKSEHEACGALKRVFKPYITHTDGYVEISDSVPI